MSKKTNQKRIVVYVSEQDYLQLKSKLALLGTTVSAWFRKKIQQFINK